MIIFRFAGVDRSLYIYKSVLGCQFSAWFCFALKAEGEKVESRPDCLQLIGKITFLFCNLT